MVARNRKVDMRGLTLQVGALEIDGEVLLDADDVTANTVVVDGSITVSGADYTFKEQQYKATVTVANGATTGKEAAIAIPANFIPKLVAVECTVASTNACALVDIGDDADTDSFVDGAVSNDLTTTGYKGTFACNGVRGQATGTTGALVTPDEVEIVVSADPGATGVTLELTFFGTVITAA